MGQRRGKTKHSVEGINVFVRVRASCAQDEGEDTSQAVKINESKRSVCVRDAVRPNGSIECTYDRIFGPESVQEDIFLGLVPALEAVIKGFNACVLAYGQTGSGKTHTLIGPGGGTRLPGDQEEWGIIPRAVQFLFDRLALASEEDETFSYSVTCSFLQIYNEQLVDLLLQDGGAEGAAAGRASLQIREETGGGGGGGGRQRQRCGGSGGGLDTHGEGGATGVSEYHQNRASAKPHGAQANESRRVFVNGLSSFRVGGAQDVLRYVNLGASNRRVRATKHNEASSRSHAVMQLTVEVKSGGEGSLDEDGAGGVSDAVGTGRHVTYRQAKLSLVDLAGSEKMDSGLNISKGHFKELRSINQSLSTLGNVVSALSEKGRTHIPYRDSKLTRLLQDSLGGNTKTTIIACVNPSAEQTLETINTLQFADRAKKVMVRLRANEVVDDRVLLARAQAEIKRLKRRLREALEGTLLGAAESDDDPHENGAGGCPRHKGGGGSEETTYASKKIKVEPPNSCIRSRSGEGAKYVEVDTEDSTTAAAGTNSAEEHHRGSTDEGKEETAPISAAATTASVVASKAAHKRQAAKLIAENERLREDNDRLRADVQRLVLLSNKQRLRRQRRQQRSVGRSGKVPVGPSSSPIDWSARYADAAAEARRRRPGPSLRPSSNQSLNQGASSSSSSRVTAMGKKRSASPSPASPMAATVPARVLSLPKFCRRQFGVDGGDAKGAGGEGEPVEEQLSEAEVRALIEIIPDVDATISPENQEAKKEATQLAMFRREIEEGVECESPIKRGGGSGGGGIRALTDDGGAVRTNDGATDGNPDKETDIELFLDQSQRLEDMMFEAQDRERRRLRDERYHLASVRKQRLALEEQLAELTRGGDTDADNSVPHSTTTAKPAVKMDSNHVPRLPSTLAENDGSHQAHTEVWKQSQQQQQQPPPPCFDGAVSVPGEHQREKTTTTSPILEGKERKSATHSKTNGSSNKSDENNNNDGSDGENIGCEEQPSSSSMALIGSAAATTTTTGKIPTTTASTTAMMMAVLAPPEETDGSNVYGTNRRGNSSASNNPALGARPTIPATKLPPEQRRQQTGRGVPVSTPTSHRNPSPSSGLRQRRPATSTGGPPSGSSRATSRSRRTKLRVGGSRSPMRGKRLAFVEPASPRFERNRGGTGSNQHHQLRQQQGRPREGSGGDSRAPQAAAHPLLASASPKKSRRFGRGADRTAPDRGGCNEQGGAAERGLSYGVADLGLRLKVYSFRYDHHYECQVVGYDSRRRMHRCAYDTTGEKQWHDLANKRFEVVGHNGVVLRSTESAPPAPATSGASTCPVTTNNNSNAQPLLLLPTSPGTPSGR